MPQSIFLRSLIAGILVLLVSIGAYGQTSGLKGFVYEAKNGEPIFGATVAILGTSEGTQTDINGFFAFSKLKAGVFTVRITNIGSDTVLQQVSLVANQSASITVNLQEVTKLTGIVEISGERQEKLQNVGIAIEKITPKQIKLLPSIGGEPDLAQYLQVLPGVVTTGDQGGQLYIRGGSPVQNLVLLDGMVIYNPFHSIGLFSVFETELLRNVEVFTGGFGAEYGGRMSAVMNLTTRDGNRKRYSGMVGVNPFTSKVIVEGPFKKQKQNSNSGSSFVLTAKRSYLNTTSQLLYDYVDTNGLPYSFTDVYAKTSFTGANGSKLNFFGFRQEDDANFQSTAQYKWRQWGAGANFLLVPNASATVVNGIFAFTRYNISLQEESPRPRQSEIFGFNAGLNFTNFLGKDEVAYGFNMSGFRTDFSFTNPTLRLIQQSQNTTEIAGYVTGKKVFGKKAVLEPGFHLHYYASLSQLQPEPRLAFKYNITNILRFKAAGGWFSQNFLSAVSDRDVVNLFYGFLSGPDNLQTTFLGEPVNNQVQRARHIITGLEWDVTKDLELNFEGYLKDFTQIVNLNRDKIYDDSPENQDKPEFQRKDFILERGTATGFDFRAKYERKRLYLWATYSLTFVERNDGQRTYFPHFDRRHNSNIVASYRLGKQGAWELSSRFNLGSGFPFTKTQGFYEQLDFSQGVGTDYTNQNGQLGILYGDLNSGRLPYYHRLDLSLKRSWPLGENTTLEGTASVINAYNRQNIFYVNRVTGQIVYQLPVLPSIGFVLQF